MAVFSEQWNYPKELPVVEHREEILDALKNHPVVVVVSDTGSGKTTQLPKMVAEAMGPDGGRIGCTQPRRIAAASVAKRVAEELRVPLGGFVGYQVRFEDQTGPDTRIKFMTDGILLAETQRDPLLRQYEVLILDEAHERSLNIDFLLGYLKQLLARRRDLKLVISSATLDAGSFAAFFASGDRPAPVIEAPGRMFPVEEHFLPAREDEDLPQHVVRAMAELQDMGAGGDVLVFLPGEREIRDCADALVGARYPNTEILPLFARLGLADQQRVFQPGRQRRVILATNVAETSLTIPGIRCVIDSGVARVSRWAPGKGVQRLLIEPVSQASARQRKGRCGRVAEGTCLRLYEEENLEDRPAFTDPEIRRSSLAGVILRMKTLRLPAIEDFPFLDPPSPKAISEGYRALREVGALTRDKSLTEHGHRIARLPVDPRLGRMLIEAESRHCVVEMLPIIAALESSDPRERPADKAHDADRAQERWKDIDSDFCGILRMWRDLLEFRVGRGRWQGNQLRKFCKKHYLNFRRVREWGNIVDELSELVRREWKVKLPKLDRKADPPYDAIHRCLLAGVPRQFGLWDRENKAYHSASGGFFSVFPGSGLFGLKKRHEWLVAMELVETNKLWARRVARIDPSWVEEVAPHLCRSRYGEAHWDINQGAVYGKERVICGGLPIIDGRRIHYGRVDPKLAHAVFLREGLVGGGIRKKCRFLDHLNRMRDEVAEIEHKLRRPGGLWSDEAVIDLLHDRIPVEIHTAASFHKWLAQHEDRLMLTVGEVVDEDLDALGAELFPDVLRHAGEDYTVYYNAQSGERDEGVTLGVHVDQLPGVPDWLPGWGVDGDLPERAECLLRSLPKDFRRRCQPIAGMAEGFAHRWMRAPKPGPIEQALAQYAKELNGSHLPVEAFNPERLPVHLVTKVWVCDDDGGELAMGTDVLVLKRELADHMRQRFESVANEQVEATGISRWDGEPLPDRVDTPGGGVHPALVDEGATVGIKAHACAADAAESHRAGIVRLFLLARPEQYADLVKHFPLDAMSRLELRQLGAGSTSIEDLVRLAAEGAIGHPVPRSPEAFQLVVDRARGEWHGCVRKLADAMREIGSLEPRVREWIAAHRGDRHLAAVAEDLEEQFQWLFRGGFAWRAGYDGLLEYPWRLKAIQSRLGRIQSLPIVKDLEKMERLRGQWTPWFRQWTAHPDEASLWPHGWLLEDLRVKTFAPDMSCPRKVSEKRVEESWAKLAIVP